MINNLYFQRDSFITEIYKAAKKDKKIYFLSADFGAASLDILTSRKNPRPLTFRRDA